jgi:hypothetical protein
LRIVIELATDRGRQSWVVSDVSWLCALNGEPGWEKVLFKPTGWRPAFVTGHAGFNGGATHFMQRNRPMFTTSWMLASGVAGVRLIREPFAVPPVLQLSCFAPHSLRRIRGLRSRSMEKADHRRAARNGELLRFHPLAIARSKKSK